MVVYTEVAVIIHAIIIPAGPPVERADPDPTKRPVPMDPPIAIICKCLFFKLLVSLELVALWLALCTRSNEERSSTVASAGLKVSLKFCHLEPRFVSYAEVLEFKFSLVATEDSKSSLEVTGVDIFYSMREN